MRRNKMNKKSGVSTTEIAIAVLVFAVAAIPLYYAISFGSNQDIQLDKIARANKVLESFRDEIKSLDFETVHQYGSPIDARNLPPNSFNEFLEAQKRYKDYEFKATSDYSNENDIEALIIKAQITWHDGTGNKESIQKISFMKVK
jgi:hypothetical protein